MLDIPFRCGNCAARGLPDATSAPMIHGILLAATCKPPRQPRAIPGPQELFELILLLVKLLWTLSQVCIEAKKNGGRACKPDSVPHTNCEAVCVRGDHSSSPGIATGIQQPTRGFYRAGPALPSYLALHHAGFSVPPVSPPERWALTPPFHPCQTSRAFRRRLTGFPVRCHRASLRRRSILCGTFRSSAAPRRN